LLEQLIQQLGGEQYSILNLLDLQYLASIFSWHIGLLLREAESFAFIEG